MREYYVTHKLDHWDPQRGAMAVRCDPHGARRAAPKEQHWTRAWAKVTCRACLQRHPRPPVAQRRLMEVHR